MKAYTLSLQNVNPTLCCTTFTITLPNTSKSRSLLESITPKDKIYLSVITLGKVYGIFQLLAFRSVSIKKQLLVTLKPVKYFRRGLPFTVITHRHPEYNTFKTTQQIQSRHYDILKSLLSEINYSVRQANIWTIKYFNGKLYHILTRTSPITSIYEASRKISSDTITTLHSLHTDLIIRISTGNYAIENLLQTIGSLMMKELLPQDPIFYDELLSNEYCAINADTALLELPWHLSGEQPLALSLRLGLLPTIRRKPSLESLAPHHNNTIVCTGGENTAVVDEARAITDILSHYNKPNQILRNPTQFNRSELLMRLNNADIVHYAGHGTVNKKTTLVWKIGQRGFPLTAFAGLPSAPTILFSNACTTLPAFASKALTTTAQLLMENGCAAFISIIGMLPEPVKQDFVTTFYRILLQRKLPGLAYSKACEALAEKGNPTWLLYRFFGDPAARIVW